MEGTMATFEMKTRRINVREQETVSSSEPKAFNLQRIFPLPVLFISVVLGSISCILAIVGTLFFSWIPTLITNDKWWYIIGGLTVICLVIAAVGSMLASSEAAWQDLSK